MRYFLIIALLPCLVGCRALSSLKQQKTLTESRNEVTTATLAGAVDIVYPESTQFAPVASGNSQISIVVAGPKGLIKASKQETKTADESHSSSFSIDEWVESVPVWLWPCMIFGLIGLVIVYIVWSKTTAAGKATDHLIAGGINLANKHVDRMSEELVHMEPGSAEHTSMKRLLDKTKEERSTMMERQRPQFARRATDQF